MNVSYITHSRLGSIALLWMTAGSTPFLQRILLSCPDSPAEILVRRFFPDAETGTCDEMESLADEITRLADGEPVVFSRETPLQSCGNFQRQVLTMLKTIPRGSVITYRTLASRLNKPGGARAVGNALSDNPFPLVLPCHRVVRSDGTLGGYQGGTRMKALLLGYEGIALDGDIKVPPEKIDRQTSFLYDSCRTFPVPISNRPSRKAANADKVSGH